jgi:hypothetical protein
MPEPNIFEEPTVTTQGGSSDGGEKKPDELILGRFKSPDEVIKAYAEAEAKMTQANQKASELERINQELQTRLVAQPAAKKDTVDNINDDELFWTKPMEVINKVIRQNMEPFTMTYYEQQKSSLRSDPEFQKLEAQIDGIANMYPDVKTKPGAVEQLFKMVKGLNFNPTEFENRVREKIKLEEEQKRTGMVEGGQGRDNFVPAGTMPPLTEEEKRVAKNQYYAMGVTDEQEAYKRYADAKVRMGGR